MRKVIPLYSLFALLGASSQVLALTSDDTMTKWKMASEADRSALLDSIGPSLSPAYKGEKDQVASCLDQAASSEAHASLLIRDIARTCVAIVEQRDPDAPQEDI